MPASNPPRRPASAQSGTTYNIERQVAHQISNVARDQHIHYARESFLRAVAAYRSKARTLLWLGLILFAGGFIGYALVVVNAISSVQDSMESGSPPTDFPFGPDLGVGVQVGLIAFMITVVGIILAGIGLIMHLVAAARAHKVDSDPRHSWNRPEHN